MAVLNSFPAAVIAGTVLGFLSGLGIGGGSLLILWLSAICGIKQETARMINLMFFIPAALISCFFRWKQGSLPLGKILPAAIAGCICAGITSVMFADMDTTLLKKLFGALLIATGIRELFYRPRKER